MTKAMTGLVIADAVRRGEIRMDAPVETYLPPAEGVTGRHCHDARAGHPHSRYRGLRRRRLRAAHSGKRPLGLDFLTSNQRADDQGGPCARTVRTGRVRVLHPWVGNRRSSSRCDSTHVATPDLMRTRLFEPLGMRHTAIQVDHALVEGGRSATGLPVRPWVMDAYAPGGSRSLHDREGPGEARHRTPRRGRTRYVRRSNRPRPRISRTPASAPSGRSLTWQTGQTITWHSGQTGGYASYLGLDRARNTAVIVLSDVANDASDLGTQLLARRR